MGAVRTLRGEPESNGVSLLRVEPGVQANLLACQNTWCRIDLQGTKGWIQRAYLWGVYPNETIE
jgi:SH3-like domain-containing protein